MRNKFCKKGNHQVEERDFYKQGNMCKSCRSERDRNKREAKSGEELAEYLLHQSCIRALERVRRNGNKRYIDVKCQWEKPGLMKEALMNEREFWLDWVELTKIYEKSGKLKSKRPTIDRIEANPSKKGHYYLKNLQALSAGDNSRKAITKRCIIFLIKEMQIVEVSRYETINEMMKRLKIAGYNTLSIERDTGVIKNIGNGYSLLVQTFNGQLKNIGTPMYKRVINKQLIIFDKITGEERVLRETQSISEVNGIFIDLQVSAS